MQPRHPPPPPRHHPTATYPWPPRGPPYIGIPLRPPPPQAFYPRPPWPPRQAHPHHHSFPTRSVQAIGRPRVPYNPRRFVTPPPVKQDPEVLWLAGFVEKHIKKSPELADVHATQTVHEPPLRCIRQRLSELTTLVDELEANALELVDLEQSIAGSTSPDGLDVARLKLQAERKRNSCEQLRAQLGKLQEPKPLGMGDVMVREIVAFTKRIQKKKEYRKRKAEKLRAERTIQQRLHETTPAQSNEQEALQSASPRPDDRETAPIEPPMARSQLARERQQDRQAAQKVLLALDLREKRDGPEMTDTDKQTVQHARAQAIEVLDKKRKRKRKRKSQIHEPHVRQQIVPPTTTMDAMGPAAPSTSTNCQRILPLRDPSPRDMETLIAVRRQWDFHLVPSKINGASAIPPHFVEPPAKPTAQWSQFVHICTQ